VITVLVVDDDFRVARIHSAFVDRVEGFHTVGVAHTGADALQAARDLGPDLILLDLYLPDVFGLDLISRLRLDGSDSDVIVISAANESQTVERAVKLGVASYLLKPFTLDDLAARLNEYRSQHRAVSVGSSTTKPRSTSSSDEPSSSPHSRKG
jgi:response regulator of citrate/malate metabolism